LTVYLLARYKAALAAVFLIVPAGAMAERVAGASLPDGSKAIGERRYRLSKGYEEALKYYKVVYPPAKYRRLPIANQPGIKAIHIENPEAKPGGWEGLNVYELDGEARVFVLVASQDKGKQKRQ
jgi:hypothetical protein